MQRAGNARLWREACFPSSNGFFTGKTDEFVFKTRNFVSKTRNFCFKNEEFVFKMMNFAAHALARMYGALGEQSGNDDFLLKMMHFLHKRILLKLVIYTAKTGNLYC